MLPRSKSVRQRPLRNHFRGSALSRGGAKAPPQEGAMQNCIRINLADDREFSKCLKIIAEELCLDERAFQIKERRPESAVICFCEAECAKLFCLYYALENNSDY